MDEIAKTEARNYLSAAGFFLLGVYFLIYLFMNFSSSTFVSGDGTLHIILGVVLLLIATLLIVLRKRDMIAILFMMLGFHQFFLYMNASAGVASVLILGYIALLFLILITGKDKGKWLLFPIVFFLFLLGVNAELLGSSVARYVLYILIIVFCLYYAFCCACERCRLPGSEILKADELTDFKASGSVLGYMLFALLLGGYAFYYFSGGTAFIVESADTIELLCGALMIFVAILLLAVGKMRFTPVMFILLGVCCITECFIYDTTVFYALGIAEIILGVFALLRKESRILPGLMILIFSLTCFPSLIFEVNSQGFMLVSAILNLIPCLIAIYLSFVVYSQRKLPKF